MNRYLKGFLCIMLLITLTLAAAPLSAAGGLPVVENASSACVINVDSGTIVYSMNTDKAVYPAATVKLMTALLAAEHFEGRLDRMITVKESVIDGAAGNRLGLKAGEMLSVRDLLAGLLLSGANDAAAVLAYEVAGGDSFVRLMNERAAALGATNTVYLNASGLDEAGMLTTARDIALVAAEAYRCAAVAELADTVKYTISATNLSKERVIYNRNNFITTYYSADYYWSRVNGLIAGMTPQAGYVIAASAQADNGLTYIAVVTGGASVPFVGKDGELDSYLSTYTEAEKLLSWAFEAFEYRVVLKESEAICELPVTLSANNDYVALTPAHEVELFLPVGIELSQEIEREISLFESQVEAPVEAGTQLGELILKYEGKYVATVELVANSTIPRSGWKVILAALLRIVRSKPFVICVIILAILSICGVLLKANYLYRLERKRAAQRRSGQDKR